MRLANPLSFALKSAHVLTNRFALLRALLSAALIFTATTSAVAGGPRWFSGPPYFYTWYVKVAWYTNQPSYYTDPGDLSPSVNHAAADAIVAQAAAVWNIPTASLLLTQGGSLNEHVSSANITAGAGGLTFPADVQSTNYQAKQIAVIYDTDGSVTDALLGSGASDPSGCLQNGVTESVDLLSRDGHIDHAMLILNGRCTGPEPEKQLQLQYQLERAFGRILGLGWSQTNDNVFTGSPTPTATQALNWPIMHPIDIVCGPYTYQCLPQPFTLRPDDISSLQELYFINFGQAGPGKQASWTNGGGVYGSVNFPNGQGMEGVNVVVRRRAPFWDTPEDWQMASGVSGYGFRGQSATSITPLDGSLAASLGAPGTDWEGTWRIQTIPIPPSESWNDLIVTTEAINPLYSGQYAIGAQAGNTMSPSGSPQVQVSAFLANGRDNGVYFTPQDAAPSCSAQADGTEGAPSAVPQSGWWTGTLCGYAHQTWSLLPVQANRTFTIEITALDEQGAVTMTKAMPAIGVWRSTDRTGTLPTVASATKAFNSMTVGLTTLHVQNSSATPFRIAVADQRGAGRPDFGYQARVLYANAVAPANLPADGGPITITGMGFRQGNIILINGTPAAVTSWTATTIVATAPSLHTLGLSRKTVASVTVQDASTGGSSVISSALSYAAPVESLQLLSSPTGTVPAGTPLPTAFSVKATAPDGFTPIVGEAVSFSATSASFGQCSTPTCTLFTNSAGIASATVIPMSQGTVNLTATGRSGSANASFTVAGGPDALHLISAPTGVTTLNASTSVPLKAQLLSFDGKTPRAASSVTLSVVTGTARFAACSAPPCVLTTDAQGVISTTVKPTSSGVITVQLASISSSVAATFTAAPESIQLKSAPAGTQSVGSPAGTAMQVKVVAGDGVTPVQGEAVVLTAAGGAVQFGACGGAVCTLTTDAQGFAQSSVTPLSAGAITLSAIGNAGAVTAVFTAVPPKDLFRTITAPSGTVFVGDAAATPFAVRITAADGVTPLAGKPVTFTTASGTALFGACGASTCTVTTDAVGLASTSVSPASTGLIEVVATSEAGTLSAAPFTAAVRIRSLAAAKAVQYVAEAISFIWTSQVTLNDNSAATSGVPVAWASAPGLSFAAPSSTSNSAGVAIETVSISNLVAGQRVQGSVCAWTSVCSPLAVVGVAQSDFRLEVVSGAGQSNPMTVSAGVVTLRVVDLNGNPVAGVPVHFEQVVTNWEAPCLDSGRCPIASTLTTRSNSAVSDGDGLITVQPAEVLGVPTLTHLSAIAGSQGFATLSVEKHP